MTSSDHQRSPEGVPVSTAPPALHPLRLLVLLVVLAVALQVGRAPTATSAPRAAVGEGLSLTASASPTVVTKVGQSVAYTVVVRNRGTSGVGNLLVSDPAAGLSALV